MRTCRTYVVVALWVGVVLSPVPALAQTAMPPPSGEVAGEIINQNQGAVVTDMLEVMLHVWDKDNVNINMQHGQSASDGTFRFTGVELEPQYLYGVMTVFDGVTYLSEVLPPTKGSDQLDLDVPVYETIQDTSGVQVDQMHVLFNFAGDGLETTEIYSISNAGTRTVKDAVTLDDGTSATMRYPLPADADFVFFQPDEGDRFVKFAGGFADTSPLLPGGQGHQHAVKYLVPYSRGRAYTYTAALDMQAISFLLPHNAGILLKGDGLAGPQPITLDNGVSYAVYSYSDVRAGQTIRVTLSGAPAAEAAARPGNLTLSLALGGGILGLALIGAGLWWRLRPTDGAEGETASGTGSNVANSALEDVIDQIAQLYEAHERGEVTGKRYDSERKRLLQEARDLTSRQEHRG
ncbi:MAG: hypothetical protein V1755_16010 [Chloroflexota bacterium]